MSSLAGRMLRRGARAATRIAGSGLLKTIGGGLVRSIPGAGLALAAFDVGMDLAGGGYGPSSSSMPALPPVGGGSPMGYAAQGIPAGFNTQAAGRGSYAMPEMTMELMAQLKAAGLFTSFNELKTYRRSSRKDQVVVHPVNSSGVAMTFALNKKLARQWKLWKPAAKPPMSAGVWHAVQKANRAVKTLQMMNREVKKVANFGAKSHGSNLRIYEKPGVKLIGRKAA